MLISREKVVVGWTEYVDFPDWKIEGIKAKIDTGARTSALHVEDVEELGHHRIRFNVMIGPKQPFHPRRVTAKVLKTAHVRSSNGVHTERYYVRTRICLGGFEKEIDLTLVSREKMRFRMLLGRKALEHDFVVDVSHRHVITPRKRKKKAAKAGKTTKKR